MQRQLRLSPRAREAAGLLGANIRLARRERRWTAQDLADRVGVSRPTIQKVERGDPSVSLGTALEAASILGIPLFHDEAERRRVERGRIEDRLALLPRPSQVAAHVDDAF